MNKNIGFSILIFATGIFAGWLFWGSSTTARPMAGSHVMSDGTMMMDENHQMSTTMTMHSMMQSMTAGLTGKTGNDFDAAFLEEMIPHHQGAVEMARMVLVTSKRPELITLANDIIAAQQKEINMMRGWQKEWFGIQPE